METAFVRLTSQCNAKCPMCSVWKREAEFLTKKEITKLLRDLKKNNISKAIFTGGEPTIYPYFSDVNKLLFELKMSFGFITNASVLHLKWDTIFKYKLPDFIIFSLDSVSNLYHDKNRRINNLTQTVISNINLANTHKINVIINTVITNKNFSDLVKMSEQSFMKNVVEWHWIPIKYSQNLKLSKQEWKKLYEIYKQIKIKNKNLNIINTFINKVNLKSWENLSLEEYTTEYYQNHNCNMATKMLFFEINGEVFRCNSFDYSLKEKMIFGNFKKDSIAKIIKISKQNNCLINPGCKNCDPRNQLYNSKGIMYENWFN